MKINTPAGKYTITESKTKSLTRDPNLPVPPRPTSPPPKMSPKLNTRTVTLDVTIYKLN